MISNLKKFSLLHGSNSGEYFDTDRDTFFSLAHIENPFREESNTSADDSEQDCKICFSDSPEVGVRNVQTEFGINSKIHFLFNSNCSLSIVVTSTAHRVGIII